MEETLEQVQARHRKEQRELIGRITSKKKNATKKTRKGINDECAELERQLKDRQAEELVQLAGQGTPEDKQDENGVEDDAADDDAAVNGVTSRIQNATIQDDDGTKPEPQPQTSQQQDGGGKKRNRQKERMARRAAEQEEAAIKAEEEAKNMTDHRGLERKYMAEVFTKNSLVEEDIRPDGHCLFSAVADQLSQQGIPLREGGDGGDADEKPAYKIIREAATSWMGARPDDYAPFLEEPLDSYLVKMRDTAEWGGQLELAALAARYGVGIKVVQDGRTETIEPPSGDVKETIWLAYYRHGFGLGEHYNSLRKKA